MLASAALLLVLDGAILSTSPNTVREAFALVVTLVVGGFIVATWVATSKLEKKDAGASSQGRSG